MSNKRRICWLKEVEKKSNKELVVDRRLKDDLGLAFMKV